MTDLTIGFTPSMNDAGVHALHQAFKATLGPVETVQAVFKAMHEAMPKAVTPADVIPSMSGNGGNWRTQR